MENSIVINKGKREVKQVTRHDTLHGAESTDSAVITFVTSKGVKKKICIKEGRKVWIK